MKPAPLRILIVDDETPARDRLHRLLAGEPDIAWIGHAADGAAALALTDSASPDVIFLDVQMPELSGIEVAASLPDPAPLIVFATAYDAYALQAFDANAVDYLLKPFDRERLQRALARVRERLAARALLDSRPDALAGLGAQRVRQLLVSERGVTRIIQVDQIGWIETADNYVLLHLTDHSTALLRQTLSGLLERLGPAFVRCHRRAAVRIRHVYQIRSLDKGDAELLLRDGARVPCSRQHRAAILAALTEVGGATAPAGPGRHGA